ncbi:MAG: helix-turn-helix domain-containing protein [Tabrizicola sp.]|nr:helix-turn-helix domain-containing protein [Tabrizicola sp.]
MAQAPTEPPVDFSGTMTIGNAVGAALHNHRVAAGLSIRELGKTAGVSSAMISRIENGQVSPSLATLDALAASLGVPVVSLFQNTIRTADVNFVKAGEGIGAKRLAPGHVHDYRLLASFQNQGMTFTVAEVTLERKDNGTHPVYYSRGFVYMTPIAGRCSYDCGGTLYDLGPGDSLTFDAQIRHGAASVTTERFTFFTVAAMRI